MLFRSRTWILAAAAFMGLLLAVIAGLGWFLTSGTREEKEIRTEEALSAESGAVETEAEVLEIGQPEETEGFDTGGGEPR